MILRLAALLAFLLPAAAQNTIHRDWAADPAVVQIDPPGDIYAIGDVHGDSDRLLRLLRAARLVDGDPRLPAGHWTAGNAVVVFTGDMVDKGPHSVGTIQLIRALRDAGRKQGGQVVILMGNHEAEFLANPDAGKSEDFLADLKAAGLNAHDVAACRGDLGEFLCRLPFAARVGDWFFSHAGNSGGRKMDQLIADLRKGVDQDGFATAQLQDANSLLEARLGGKGPGGRPWFEADSPRRSGEQLLADYASALGVAHLVEGHQHDGVRFQDGAERQAGQMMQLYGRIFFIDTGMSRGVGDSGGAVLHIRRQGAPQAEAICPSGMTTVIWDTGAHAKLGAAAVCPAQD
jgi:hypothetical protein